MSEWRSAVDGASSRKHGIFSVRRVSFARAGRLGMDRGLRPGGPGRKALFLCFLAGLVMLPIALVGGLRWESALRAAEAREKPWRLDDRARRGEATELASAAMIQGKVAPLRTRALRYLDRPPALWDGAADVPRWHWSFQDAGTGRRKPDGEYRVVVLGDSFSGGDPNFSDFLDGLLRARVAARGSARVILLGLEGYNTVDSYGMLRHVALDLDPDLVIYEHYQNDFEGGTWEDLQYRQRFAPCFEDCTGPRLPPRLRFQLVRHSALYKEVLRRAKVIKYQYLLPRMEKAIEIPVLGWAIGKWARWYNPVLYPEADLPIDYRYHRLVMEEMIALTEERGIDFAILRITPFPHYGGDSAVAGEEAVFEALRRDHPALPLLEARAHLEARIDALGLPKEALYLDPVEPGIDTHPSAMAHYLMAEMFVRERWGGPSAAAGGPAPLADRAKLIALLPPDVARALGLMEIQP